MKNLDLFGSLRNPTAISLLIVLSTVCIYSQPTLNLIVEDGFDVELIKHLEREFSDNFNVIIDIEWIKDIDYEVHLVESVIDGSLLNKTNIIRKDNALVLFITNNKLFFKEHPSGELRGFTNMNIQLGVVSSKKIRTECAALGLSFEFQFIKAAKHEFLHILGLKHCDTTKRCLMVSSFPQSNFHNSFDLICSNCFDKIDSQLVNSSLMIHH